MELVYEVNGEKLNGKPLNKTLRDGDYLKISMNSQKDFNHLKVSLDPVEIEVKLYRKITSFHDFLMPFEEYAELILEQAQMEAGTIKEAYLLQNEKDTIIAMHWMTEKHKNLWFVLTNPHEMKCGAVTCQSIERYDSLRDVEFSYSAEIIETWEGNQ